ncbi:MAG: mechanosensitive ion channel [Dehalococcoidia bacterium]|jgi:small conductance mechanosensitive channel|nr:mechanosensitive ion channel [Dehalococcoidia bacterium]
MVFVASAGTSVASLWHWISAYSIWILMFSALALAVLVFGRPRLHARLEGVSPNQRARELCRFADGVIALLLGIVLTAIATAAVALTLSREGQQALITPELIKLWFMEHGILVVLIMTIGYLLYRLLKSVIPGLVESSMSSRGKGRKAREDLARRAQTLSSALITIAAIIVLTVAAFMVLQAVGVDVTPLLATAGVVGIAVGLGAQSLIKDMLGGLFILMEDQYNKGDVVKVAGISGLVEDVTLKRTVLRDLDGIVHSIPNGEITTASNYTKEYSRLNLDVPVSYSEDLERVIQVINRVGQDMAKDPLWGPKLRSAPQSLGVNKFAESGVEIKVLGDTKPMMQWEVARELRLRIKKTFDAEHIEIPFPHVRLLYDPPGAPARATCPSCRHVNPPASRFCAQCGLPLTPDASNLQPPREAR